jgi:MtN3 and saliva related transmembrane protein
MIWNYIVEFGFSISLLVNAFLFIPQARLIYRRKDVNDVSLVTFIVFNIIQLFTVFHGLIIRDYILVFGFLLSMLTCGTVSWLILYYRYIKINKFEKTA